MNTLSFPLPTGDRPPDVDGSWQRDAACADTDPELFFAGDDRSVAAAKELCASCPVRVQCLEAALALGEMHGVWGGVAEGQRRRMIRARRREARQAREPATRTHEAA